MPLCPIGKNVKLSDYQDFSLNGTAPVVLFEFDQPQDTSTCRVITRVIIGQSEQNVSTFSETHPELPVPPGTGSCLAGKGDIIELDGNGVEAGRKPRFVFVSKIDNSNPPMAVELSLAQEPDGLPKTIFDAYQAGALTCYTSVNQQIGTLRERVATLEHQLQDLQNPT